MYLGGGVSSAQYSAESISWRRRNGESNGGNNGQLISVA